MEQFGHRVKEVTLRLFEYQGDRVETLDQRGSGKEQSGTRKKKKNLKKVYVVKEDLEMVDVTVEEAGDRVRRRQTIRSGNP